MVTLLAVLLGVYTFRNLLCLSLAPCCQIYRVNDEIWVVETAVWPIPYFLYVFPALKGLSQPLDGRRLISILRQVVQVEMCYCAAIVIFIVLLIIPKTLSLPV